MVALQPLSTLLLLLHLFRHASLSSSFCYSCIPLSILLMLMHFSALLSPPVGCWCISLPVCCYWCISLHPTATAASLCLSFYYICIPLSILLLQLHLYFRLLLLMHLSPSFSLWCIALSIRLLLMHLSPHPSDDYDPCFRVWLVYLTFFPIYFNKDSMTQNKQ